MNLKRKIKQELNILINEDMEGGKPPGEECCLKYVWEDNRWNCVKEKPDCPAGGTVIAPDLDKIQMKEGSRGIREERLNEKKEAMCCDCWEFSGFGNYWVNGGDGKWRCCGWRPCGKFFGKMVNKKD